MKAGIGTTKRRRNMNKKRSRSSSSSSGGSSDEEDKKLKRSSGGSSEEDSDGGSSGSSDKDDCSSDSDTSDEETPIRNLRQLHYSESMMKVISELKEGKHNKSEFGKLAIKWEKRLTKVISNKEENRRAYKEFRKDVKKALKKHKMDHLINMGDELNDDHLLAIVLHFATEAEKDVKTGSDGLSKMDWELSACIAFVKEMIGSSIVRQDYRMKHEHEYDDEEKLEEAARAYWKRHKADVIKSICTFDHRFFISQNKDKFSKEVTELAALDECPVEVLDLIGVMNTSFHYLNYHFVHDGKKMPSIIATTHVFNTAYDGEINTEAKLVSACGYIPHPECWLAGYIRDAATYNPELLEYFDGVINRGFGVIFRVVLGKGDEYELDTNMATRHGLGDLTIEEHKALAEALLDIRIRGGTTSGLMRQLAKELIDAIMTRYRVSLEAAAEMMGDEIMKYKNTKSSANDKDDNVSKAIKALTDHKEKKWNMNDVEKLAKKLSSLYLGSIKTGLMSTLASKMYANGLDEDSTIDDITNRLTTLKDQHSSDKSSDSDNHETAAFRALVKHDNDILVGDMSLLAKKLYSLHIGSIKTGLMSTLASKMYANGFNEDSTIEDITKRLETLKGQHSSDKSSVSDNGETAAFKALVKHDKDILDGDMASLAKKLYSLQMGGIKTGLMITLARNIYCNNDKLPDEIKVDDITTQLESLKKQYTSMASRDEAEYSDLYKAFVKLMDHNDKNRDMSILAEKL